LMVLEQGRLEIGTEATQVSPGVTAEIIIADRLIDKNIDPTQLGTGVQGLGRITMHGSVKTPTFLRLAREPIAGATTLVLERPVQGWRTGDRLVIPDTRQLRGEQRGPNRQSHDEQVQIASVSGDQVTLAAPL